MVELRRKSLICREVWFDEPHSAEQADLILYYHWSSQADPENATETHSLEIDLTIPDAEILGRFSASTRNQVNRGAREGLVFTAWPSPSPEVLEDFFAFYRKFTSERGLASEDPLWMVDYASQNALLLTNAAKPDGQTLVWHTYFRNASWARQLQSVSHFAETDDKETRNLVARANRFLHWKDMQECRTLGISRFDFGGWYAGDSDQKLLRVNAFKEEFGGRRTLRYHSMQAVTLAGKLFLKARTFAGKNTLLHFV